MTQHIGSEHKLIVKYGITPIQARALVLAGYTTLRQIRDTSDQELLAVRTIGEAALAKLRA